LYGYPGDQACQGAYAVLNNIVNELNGQIPGLNSAIDNVNLGYFQGPMSAAVTSKADMAWNASEMMRKVIWGSGSSLSKKGLTDWMDTGADRYTESLHLSWNVLSAIPGAGGLFSGIDSSLQQMDGLGEEVLGQVADLEYRLRNMFQMGMQPYLPSMPSYTALMAPRVNESYGYLFTPPSDPTRWGSNLRHSFFTQTLYPRDINGQPHVYEGMDFIASTGVDNYAHIASPLSPNTDIDEAFTAAVAALANASANTTTNEWLLNTTIYILEYMEAKALGASPDSLLDWAQLIWDIIQAAATSAVNYTEVITYLGTQALVAYIKDHLNPAVAANEQLKDVLFGDLPPALSALNFAFTPSNSELQTYLDMRTYSLSGGWQNVEQVLNARASQYATAMATLDKCWEYEMAVYVYENGFSLPGEFGTTIAPGDPDGYNNAKAAWDYFTSMMEEAGELFQDVEDQNQMIAATGERLIGQSLVTNNALQSVFNTLHLARQRHLLQMGIAQGQGIQSQRVQTTRFGGITSGSSGEADDKMLKPWQLLGIAAIAGFLIIRFGTIPLEDSK